MVSTKNTANTKNTTDTKNTKALARDRIGRELRRAAGEGSRWTTVIPAYESAARSVWHSRTRESTVVPAGLRPARGDTCLLTDYGTLCEDERSDLILSGVGRRFEAGWCELARFAFGFPGFRAVAPGFAMRTAATREAGAKQNRFVANPSHVLCVRCVRRVRRDLKR